MQKSYKTGPDRISMLGSMPPIRALSSYCLNLALAVAELGGVEFISFKKIYPAILYPGMGLKDDDTFPTIRHPNLEVRPRLTWYNPITWFAEGIFAHGEVLHAQWWSLPLSLIYIIICLLFRLRRKPVIFTVHNIVSHEKSLFHTIICRILFKLGDHFIVHSARNRMQLIKSYGLLPERVTQIPHGPLDFKGPRNADRDVIRNKMGFDTENRIILLFGTIRPYKGVDTALKAFKMVLTETPKARLLIAGKLWEAWKPYQQIIEELGISNCVKTYLQYIPYVDVSKFFVASDLVIIPYHHFDSQSGVAAAAVSYNKPMIVSDVGGLSELVLDKRNVVPPKDPNALANAIKRCLSDEKRLARMTEDAEIVKGKISWPSIAQKTWSVYRTVIALKKASGEY